MQRRREPRFSGLRPRSTHLFAPFQSICRGRNADWRLILRLLEVPKMCALTRCGRSIKHGIEPGTECCWGMRADDSVVAGGKVEPLSLLCRGCAGRDGQRAR